MRIICNLLTVWDSLRSPQFWSGGFPISGHYYGEVFYDGNISVLKCKRCGDNSAAWNEPILLDRSDPKKRGK